ncbi:MAG: signal peptidase II [Clostridia bacterium]|nr:signal peptidase II [Clostridia bacterium]
MIEILLLLLFVALDQFTKAASEIYFAAHEPLVLIEGMLGLTYVKNDGAAFGIFSGQQIILCIITGISIVLLSVLFITQRKRKPIPMPRLLGIALVLIIAGAIGNLIDRLCFGYVRDMIQTLFITFPVFNIADCAVTIGAALALTSLFLTKSGKAYFSSFDDNKKKDKSDKKSIIERVKSILSKKTDDDIRESIDTDTDNSSL